MAGKKEKTLWNFFDSLEGDKVVWMIVLMLILISIVCIFSSTSRLLSANQTRLDIVGGQILVVFAGLVIIFLCYKIKDIAIIRWFSKFGFILSFIMLLMLVLKVRTGFIDAITLNDATRILKVKGFQIHVYEVVKVAMVMYMAWAIEYVKKKGSTLKRKIFVLYIPFISVFILTMFGSNSSAIFIAGIMFLTIVIGGGDFKDMLRLMAGGVAVLAICVGIYGISGGRLLGRIGTLFNRLEKTDYVEQLKNSPRESSNYIIAKDKLQQPYGAKIAIHEGGFLGKGPGQSTQRYVVPDMSEDYMYSFILEEYGLVGGIFVLFLYVSLLARGSIIARNCDDLFGKSATAGLCLLISGQAFLHMFVNADIGPMTGQTLPLISHGNSAFICFCLAFGMILSISKLAAQKVERETRRSLPLVELHESVQADLSDLEAFDSGEDINQNFEKEQYDGEL